jgi:hypothetical protein
MLSQYQGAMLLPGMGTEFATNEPDLLNILYGGTQLAQLVLVPYAVIDGAARDAGNPGFTTVLRNGLIMGQVAATGRWRQFDPGASDGTQFARGILVYGTMNTQLNGANADRFHANILVGRCCINPEGVCLASSATYGLARTGVGQTVRKHFMYAFQFSDDFMGETITAFGAR